MISPSTPVITAIGMATPLGSYTTACAAARAGLNRFSELKTTTFDSDTCENIPIHGAQAAGLVDGFSGLARYALLGSSAIQDLKNNAAPQALDLTEVPIYVYLSNEYYWESKHRIELSEFKDNLPFDVDTVINSEINNRVESMKSKLIPTINNLSGTKFDDQNVQIVTGMQAETISLFAQIHEKFESGELSSCLFGAIDSLVDERALNSLMQLNLLQTAEDPIGFLPSEASVFFYLEPYESAQRRNAEVKCAIAKTSFYADEIHRYSDNPNTGYSLAKSMEDVIYDAEKKQTKLSRVFGNLNGDLWRAKEWAGALTHMSEDLREFDVVFPAQFFGETGAASTALSIGLAAHNYDRKLTKCDTLIWQIGDDGCKGSILLRGMNL